MRYEDYRRKLEFSWEELAGLRVYARSRGLDCFLSVWDVASARGISEEWGRIKVPSAKIVDLDLLRAVAGTFLPVIISTAMSTEQEIDDAVRYFGGQNLTIMHCHGAYPAPSSELNLRCIPELKRRYPAATIGYSGHEYGIATTVWAVVLGAETIERHITLDREMWGSDQASSLEPAVFAKMVGQIRSASVALGDGRKKVWDTETEKLRSLRG
jgi:N-acetylneuraminate synthase